MKIFFISLTLLFSAVASGVAQGVLLVKDHSVDSDALASPVEYRTIARFGAVFNIGTLAGQQQRIQTSRIVVDVSYAGFVVPPTVITSADLDRVNANLAALRAILVAHPNLQKFLAPYTTGNQMVVDQHKRGIYLVNAQWITATAYKSGLEAARTAAAEAERKQQLALAEIEKKQQLEQAEADRKQQLALAEAKRMEEEHKRKSDEERQQQMLARQEQLHHQETELEASLVGLQATARLLRTSVGPLPKMEERMFLLKRKLPKANFEDLYKLAPYVIECVSAGDESCVLVCRSFSTLEARTVLCSVTLLDDIDVKTYAGRSERVPVFMEHVPTPDETELTKIVRQINARNEELGRVRVSLGEATKQAKEIAGSISVQVQDR